MTDMRLLEQEVELRRLRREITCTPGDVLRFARENQIVATVVRSWQEGDFRTWEEAMTAAVCYLAQQNEQLLKSATIKLGTDPFPPVVILRPAGEEPAS